MTLPPVASSRKGPSSRSPASATPPPTTTRCRATKIVRFAIATPSMRPARAIASSACASPARAAASASAKDSRPAARAIARAGDGLEAAVVAAAARLAVDDDGVVTDLARPVLHAQAELPAEHEPAAHAGSADDADHVLGAARSADPRLGERERVAVVEQRDRSAETLFELRTHGEADPVAAEVGKEHGASVLVDEPGDRDADRVEGLGAAAELEHAGNDGLRRSRLGARRDGASYVQLARRSRGARRRRAAPA